MQVYEERGKLEYPGGKLEYPGENLSEQRREPTNSTYAESGNPTRATLAGGECFHPYAITVLQKQTIMKNHF